MSGVCDLPLRAMGSASASCPYNLDVVLSDHGIRGHQRHALDLGLCNQKAIERIAVEMRKQADLQCVTKVDR
jgi:hypothetical protein